MVIQQGLSSKRLFFFFILPDILRYCVSGWRLLMYMPQLTKRRKRSMIRMKLNIDQTESIGDCVETDVPLTATDTQVLLKIK